MAPPTVLHLTNDTRPDVHLSFCEAFRALAADGLLTHVPLAPLALLNAGREEADAEMLRIAEEARPDLLFVQSPSRFPWTGEEVAALLRRLGSPTVVLWEGDAWGGHKPVTRSLAAWLGHADAVFSVAVGAQARLFGRYTRRPVRYIAQTVPGRLWTDDPVPGPEHAEDDVLHIGGRYLRLGLLERVDGARQRDRLVRSLRRLPGCRFATYGSGWRGPGALGPLRFDDQIRALRGARMSVGWDHYRGYAGFFSNRLPISMFAGRPHVAARPAETSWLPGPECGLHLVGTPAQAVARVTELLRADPAELHTAGVAGHDWVRSRLTNLNALLHMFSSYLDVPAPPADPWQAIAAMDTAARAPQPA
ncbi:glycosyltransferase family protein [Streptomyces mesophilus]|uniref:glycosyltransferase family protein n=1 Tax=Streptomyces mesophilus TaxID=1775132 RepID=UPI00332BC251